MSGDTSYHLIRGNVRFSDLTFKTQLCDRAIMPLGAPRSMEMEPTRRKFTRQPAAVLPGQFRESYTLR
jgi:hypothetical protein